MKKHYKGLIFACITLFTTQAWSQMNPGPPMNPGFESVNSFSTDWKNTPDAGSGFTFTVLGSRTNSTSRTGSWSYLSAQTSTTTLYRHLNVSNLSIPAGNYAHLIAWAKGTNDTDSKAALGGTLNGTSSSNSSTLLNANSWTQLPSWNPKNTSTTTAVNFQCGLYFKSNSATAIQVYFDDVIAYTDNVATADITSPTAATASSSPVVTTNSATINWTNGTDAGTGIQNSIILRTTNISAATPVLNNQGMYSTAGGESGPNTVSTDWTVISTSVAASATSYIDNTVSPSTAYQYAVIHRDMAYNYSTALVITAITNLGTQVNASDLPSCSNCDIAVAAGGSLDINAAKTYKSITVAPGAKLTLSTGTLTLSNGIKIQNTASGTASFLDSRTEDNPTAIAGTVEQAITETNRNWYVAVPVSGKSAADITLSGAKIVSRNETQVSWDDVTGSLTAGVGYIAVASTNSGSTTWSLSGNLNSGKVQILVTNSGASFTGYNLLGNPYPSYLNWEQVLNLDATNASLLQSSIWYRTATYNNGLSKFDYTFNTYNSAGRIATPTSTTGYIPPMQAFWVRANNTGNVTFTNAMRSHGDGASNKLKAPKQTTQKIIRLQVSNAVTTDETVVYFDENAQNTFDNYDTQKMFNNIAGKPEIFTKVGAEQLAINGMNSIYSATEIPLGFTTGQPGDFSIFASELKNIEAGIQTLLIDKLLNKEVNLSESSTYNFSSQVTTSSDNRFALQFRVSNISTGTDKTASLNAKVFANSANQIEIVSPENCNYNIYNALGQKISYGNTGTNSKVVAGVFKSGLYIVEILNGQKLQTSKLTIR
jgi:hypothetical protein